MSRVRTGIVNSAVVAALITNATTVLLAIFTGIGALQRVGRTRRYERRILHVRELQDRSAELRAANRAYNRALEQRATEGAERRADLVLPQRSEASFDAAVPEPMDSAQAVAYDSVRVAATRVEEQVLIDLNEHWRQLSGLTPTEITPDDENGAWENFNTACAQILTSQSAKLSSDQRQDWRRTLKPQQASEN